MDNCLGTTNNGIEVYDRPKSHLSAHSVPKELLAEAISKVSQTEVFMEHVVDMGRIVGLNKCVEVRNGDNVVMVKREGRDGFTPVVKNREPEPCQFVTLVLKKVEGHCILITAFIGGKCEPEPWDKRLVPGTEEHRRATEFWNTHALIYGT